MTGSPFPGAGDQPSGSGRGWRVAAVAMVSAVLLMLPIAWAYVATRERRKVDLFNLVVIALWKWNWSQPIIADIALGEQNVPRGRSLIDTLLPSEEPGTHPSPVAEWFEAAEARPLAGTRGDSGGAAPSKRDGILRVRVTDNSETRRTIEDLLEARAKRWTLESDEPGPDGLPSLTYQVRLKKRREWSELLQALQTRLGRQLAADETERAPGPSDQQPG